MHAENTWINLPWVLVKGIVEESDVIICSRIIESKKVENESRLVWQKKASAFPMVISHSSSREHKHKKTFNMAAMYAKPANGERCRPSTLDT